MPRYLPEEVVAKVRELYEGMPLTHARIAAATGVGESTVSVLAQKNGWTRCPEARTSRRLSHDQCEAILRLREAGASARAVAAAAGCHARTVGRIAPPERRTAAFGTVAAPALGAEALVRQDLAVERTGQVLARLAERVAALPDQGPYAGAANACRGPATFDEANALLEDLARHFAHLGVGGEAEAAGEPLRQG